MTGVQTCALPISQVGKIVLKILISSNDSFSRRKFDKLALNSGDMSSGGVKFELLVAHSL